MRLSFHLSLFASAFSRLCQFILYGINCPRGHVSHQVGLAVCQVDDSREVFHEGFEIREVPKVALIDCVTGFRWEGVVPVFGHAVVDECHFGVPAPVDVVVVVVVDEFVGPGNDCRFAGAGFCDQGFFELGVFVIVVPEDDVGGEVFLSVLVREFFEQGFYR